MKIGLLGLGTIGSGVFEHISRRSDMEIKKILDLREFPELAHLLTKNFDDILNDPEIDAVLIMTGWGGRSQLAVAAMRAGKYTGIEVGCTQTVEEAWDVVRAYEETGVHVMMLENDCYDRQHMMLRNMAKQGLFGEIAHVSGGYQHYLNEDELFKDVENDEVTHYRLKYYIEQNRECYPTHALGPLMKILNINRGNRFLSIASFASKACGFRNYAQKVGSPMQDFAMGDVVTSVIKCANGETITLTHGVSLPRPYSRDGRVQGTRGIWLEDAKGIFIDGISETRTEIDVAGNPYYSHIWDPVEKFYEEYDHPIWQEFRDNPSGGHGGMDTLALQAFLNAVRNRTTPPIDVYDCAAWMAVTALSEASIAAGSVPVPFPDFTNGKWIYPAGEKTSAWDLN